MSPCRRTYWRCALLGHIWVLVSFDEGTKVATLWCSRCNPNGDGYGSGEMTAIYDEV
jgi:hypothetical protein